MGNSFLSKCRKTVIQDSLVEFNYSSMVYFLFYGMFHFFFSVVVVAAVLLVCYFCYTYICFNGQACIYHHSIS